MEAGASSRIPHRVAVMHNTRCTSLLEWKSHPLLKHARNYFVAIQVQKIGRHATAFVSVRKAVKYYFEQLIKPDYRPHDIIYLGKKLPESISLTWPEQIEVRKSLGITPDAFVIGHAGDIREQKNHPFILECMAKLKYAHRTSSPLFLLLMGDGEQKQKATLKAQAQALGIADSVIMPGNVYDIERYYKAMNLFFFPSLYEGVSTALMEAQSYGLPVVASNIAPNLEALAPVWNSYTFSLPNAQQAVLNILEIIEAGDLTQEKISAHAFVREKFGIENHCRQMDKFFDMLLKGQRSDPELCG